MRYSLVMCFAKDEKQFFLITVIRWVLRQVRPFSLSLTPPSLSLSEIGTARRMGLNVTRLAQGVDIFNENNHPVAEDP